MIELKCVRIEGGENSLKTVTFEQLPSRRGLTLDGVDANGLTEGGLYYITAADPVPAATEPDAPSEAPTEPPAEVPAAAPLAKAKK